MTYGARPLVARALQLCGWGPEAASPLPRFHTTTTQGALMDRSSHGGGQSPMGRNDLGWSLLDDARHARLNGRHRLAVRLQIAAAYVVRYALSNRPLGPGEREQLGWVSCDVCMAGESAHGIGVIPGTQMVSCSLCLTIYRSKR